MTLAEKTAIEILEYLNFDHTRCGDWVEGIAEIIVNQEKPSAFGYGIAVGSLNLPALPVVNISLPPICLMHLTPMVLGFYDLSGSAPGNGWTCRTCIEERVAKTCNGTAEESK